MHVVCSVLILTILSTFLFSFYWTLLFSRGVRKCAYFSRHTCSHVIAFIHHPHPIKSNTWSVNHCWARSHSLNSFIFSVFSLVLCLKWLFIYLFIETGKGREKERDRNINMCLPLMWLPLGILPVTQACALTGNRTGDPLVCSLHSVNWVHQPGPFSLVLLCSYLLNMTVFIPL